MTHKKTSITALALIFGLGFANQIQAAYPDQSSSTSTRTYESTTTKGSTISDTDLTQRIQDRINSKTGFDDVNVSVNNGLVTLQGTVRTAEDKQKLEREIRNIDGVKGVDSQITVKDTMQDPYRSPSAARNPTAYNDSRGNQSYYSNAPQQAPRGQPYYDQNAPQFRGQPYYDQNAPQSTNRGQSYYYTQSGDPQSATRADTQTQSSPNDFPQDRGATIVDKQLNQKIRDKVSRGWLTNSYKEIILVTNNGFVIIEGFVDNQDDQKKIIAEIQRIEGVRGIRSNLKFKNN